MLLVFWIMMGVVVALVAQSKGRSAGAWFVYGALIWPVALVHILVTPPAAGVADTAKLQAGGKKCPDCAEIIRQDARVCRYCGNRSLEPEVASEGGDYEYPDYTPKPVPTTWQKLWWNPHAEPRKRR